MIPIDISVSEKETLVDQARPWLRSYPEDVSPIAIYPEISLGELFDRLAPRYPEREALVFEGRSLRWREFERLVDRLAGSLQRLGVGKGDRVMLLLPNVPHFVVAYFAILKLGAIVVPSNPLYVTRELKTQIQETGVSTVITLDVLDEKLAGIGEGAGVRHVIVGTLVDFMPLPVRLSARAVDLLQRRSRGTFAGPLLDRAVGFLGRRFPPVRRLWDLPRPARAVVYGPRVLRFRSLLRRKGTWHRAAVRPDDLAALLHTGGTTGTPKAVMLTHRNLIANAYQMRQWFPDMQDGKETMLAPLPFVHGFGLTLCLHVGLVLGARLILIPRIVPGDILQAIRRYRPTIVPGVPAIYSALFTSRHVGEDDLRSIRWCVSGSAALPQDLREQLEHHIGGASTSGTA